MSPSLSTTRPVWVWSLPAFAVILSFLWYRKKRGSLKTDSGGAGETADDPICVTEALVTEESVLPSEVFQLTVDSHADPVEPDVSEPVVSSSQEVESSPASEPEPEPETEPKVNPIEDETPKSKSKCGKKKKSKEMAKMSNDSSLEHKDESTACILEQKLAKLDLAKQCGNGDDGTTDKQTNEDEAERDSANNSPSEVMLSSPLASGYSDTHSEDSSDSGKGCSEMLTPSRTPASGNSVSGDHPLPSIYEFAIPQNLVGRLIGRSGSYIRELKEETNATIFIKRHPETPTLKICAMEGTEMDIERALEMVRRKFPKKRYPQVTLEQVVIAPEPMVSILPENMQLYLVDGINNDVIISCLVSAGHFFVQQPGHPTYLHLNHLDYCMQACYSSPNQPILPDGVGAGALCAAPTHTGWYRAQIMTLDPNNHMCDIKFVDYGGYTSIPISNLRQIRGDFINLAFQAAECYLAGIVPVGGEGGWSQEAKELVEKHTFGKVLQAQVYGYAEDGVPLIYLYTVFNNEIVLINQELVDHGFAEWLYSEPVTEEGQEVQDEAVECPQIEEPEAVAVAV